MRATGFSVVVRRLVLDRATVEVDFLDVAFCEVQEKCAGTTVRMLQLHHRRPRQRGGSRLPDTNLPSNSLATCSECHAFLESHRALAYDNGWLVHQAASPRDVPVLRRDTWVILDDLGGYELVEIEVAG